MRLQSLIELLESGRQSNRCRALFVFDVRNWILCDDAITHSHVERSANHAQR